MPREVNSARRLPLIGHIKISVIKLSFTIGKDDSLSCPECGQVISRGQQSDLGFTSAQHFQYLLDAHDGVVKLLYDVGFR